MKKLIVLLMLMFFIVPCAHAVWTVSAAVDQKSVLGDGTRVYRIKLSAISDGSDLASFDLSTYLTTKEHEGGKLLMVISDPGATAPDADWDFTVSNELGVVVADGTDRSATVTEVIDGDGVISGYPVVYELKIDFGDIGAAADNADLYFYILK